MLLSFPLYVYKSHRRTYVPLQLGGCYYSNLEDVSEYITFCK
jgi:hypothetical protein